MIRGTTAQFQFKLPYSKYDVETAEVVAWQPNNPDGLNKDFPLPITKGYVQQLSPVGSVVTSGPWNWIDDYTLSVKFLQQETLTFSDKYKGKIQLRAVANNVVFASKPEMFTVYPIYNDEPIDSDDIIPDVEEDGLTVLDGENI